MKHLHEILNHPGWGQHRVVHHAIVQLNAGMDEKHFDLILKQHGARIERDFETLGWRVIEVDDPAKLNEVITALHDRHLILDAEPNYISTMPS